MLSSPAFDMEEHHDFVTAIFFHESEHLFFHALSYPDGCHQLLVCFQYDPPSCAIITTPVTARRQPY